MTFSRIFIGGRISEQKDIGTSRSIKVVASNCCMTSVDVDPTQRCVIK
ncbi:MAG: hypothetical protein NC452_06255 [Eubacterium sp.]|nr:hypothetical protein [Eubacterium sp.]